MVYAFVMVKTVAGKSEELLASVRDVAEVVDAHIVAGNYDIIAEVQGEEVYDLLSTTARGIQGLDGVADTKTYVSLS